MQNNNFLLDLLLFVIKSSKNRYLFNFYVNNIFDYFKLSNYKKYYDKEYSFVDNLKGYAYFYDLLKDDDSKKIFIKLIAYKLLGHAKVKLCDYKEYKTKQNKIKDLAIPGKKYKKPLKNYNLSSIGYNIKLYCVDFMLYTILIRGQYSHPKCYVEEGDYVIDAGGCFGETALIFAWQVGQFGKIFTFESSNSNLNIMKYNLSNNLHISDRITIVEKALYEKSDKTVYSVNDMGCSAFVCDKSNYNCFEYKTISIDDFVTNNKIPKIDFIKMDIEGSEFSALKGAVETIKKYKPKLSISVYHKYKDFEEISKFINELNLGYNFYVIGHSMSYHEIVLYAKVDK